MDLYESEKYFIFDGFIRVFTLVHAKFSIYFNIRIYFFCFTQPLFKNTHIRLSIIHSISI